MIIKSDLVYTIKEASEILDVHPRKLNRIAVKYDLDKIDNRYLFPGEFLIHHFNLTNVKTSQKVSKDVKYKTDEITKADLEELEEKDISVDGVKGNLVFIAKGKEYAEYLPEEYSELEQRLEEWATQQQKLEHQEQLFNVEKLGLKELLEHYKNQFEYQKKQSEKILEMHQTLIDTIQKQSTLALQRNIIEAREKDVINEVWQTKNKRH